MFLEKVDTVCQGNGCCDGCADQATNEKESPVIEPEVHEDLRVLRLAQAKGLW